MELGNIGKLALFALVIVFFIYIFKIIAKKWNIPVVSAVVEEV